MNLHLSHDDKFLDSFIENAKKYSTSINKYVVFAESGTLIYTKSTDIFIAEYSIESFKNILNENKNIEKIYFHSINHFYALIVDHFKLELKYKLIWFFYGYEVFELKMYFKSLLAKKTRKVHRLECSQSLRDKRPKNFIRNLILKIKNEYKRYKDDRKIVELIKKIHVVGHFIEEDVQRFIIPLNRSILHINWNYLSSKDLECLELKQSIGSNSTNILLGNSAANTNNHIDALYFLHKKVGNDKNILIITPLNYSGSKFYVNQVVSYGRKLFGDRFLPLLDFISKDEYYAILKKVNFAFFFNIRSQAAANINWLLNNNKVVFMHKKSTLYSFYKNKGFRLFSHDQFDSHFLNSHFHSVQNLNEKPMNKYFGEIEMKNKYKAILEVKF